MTPQRVLGSEEKTLFPLHDFSDGQDEGAAAFGRPVFDGLVIW